MSRILTNPVVRLLFLFGVLGLLVFSVREGSALKRRISNIVFDSYVTFKPREPSDKLVFVDIDDLSLSKVGQWPWPRTFMAEILRNLGKDGAKVIVFDGVLAEPDRTSPENIIPMLEEGNPAREALAAQESHDAILAQAIGEVGNFVAGFSYGSNTKPPLVKSSILIKGNIKKFLFDQRGPGSVYFQTTAQFLPELQKNAAGNGSFMASAEDDAVIRRTGLVFHDGKSVYPSLILEAVRVYEAQGKAFIKVSANEQYNNYKIDEPLQVSVGKYRVPFDAEGKMWVYYRHFGKSESVSAHKFLDEYYEDTGEKKLDGKIVFIASSAEGLMDLRATPLGMQPGVRIHMNALEQILQSNFLIRPFAGNVLEVGAAILVCLCLIILSFFVNPLWLATIALCSSVGAFWVSWYFFTVKGGLLDPVTPVIMIVLVFVASSVLSFLKTESERKQVRAAFGLYISPDFMKELTKNPDKLKLGGEIRELTVMFSDIRRFTSICEGLSPEEIIQLMNDFLTPMSDLVMNNRGTIDKYMGDAMMAFWNAPLDDSDHARNACLTALHMQEALEPINEQVRQKAVELGKEPVLLNAGIGINTGPCAVGNMGSKQRFAYSTLGDAVNLASRLESQTKNYGVNILLGESTKEQIGGLAVLELDLLQVKGRTEPTRIFTLLGDDDYAASSDFQKWVAKHQEMLDQYRARNFKNISKLAKECLKLSSGQLVEVYDLYQVRAEELSKTPPGDDWDGVFVATSK